MSPQSATPWFRFYSEVLSDRKIKRVAAMTNQPPVVIIGLWSIVLMMANDSPERGKLLITQGVPVKVEEIADTAGIDSAGCKAILEAFTGLNMMLLDDNGVLTVTQWNTRQFTSDNSTERVKRFRDRQKQGGEKGEIENDEYTKRYSNVSETPPESESESESESTPKGAEKPPPPVQSQSPVKPHAIPAVQIFVEVSGKYCLTKPQMKEINRVVGRDPANLETWRETVKAWFMNGNNPTDAAGMLDWFKSGKRSNYQNGAKQNGNQRAYKTRQDGHAIKPRPMDETTIRDVESEIAELERRLGIGGNLAGATS